MHYITILLSGNVKINFVCTRGNNSVVPEFWEQINYCARDRHT